MKKTLSIVVFLAAVATACNKEADIVTSNEEPTPEVKMVTEIVSASNGETKTKAAIDASAVFSWSTGDQIAVHVDNGLYYTTTALAEGTYGDVTDFSVTYPDGTSRNAFAVFPSTIVAVDAENYGQDAHSLDVTLPGTYNLAQVSGEATPCPMIATNNPASGWNFKQLCGLLRLTVNCVPPSTKRLEIDFDGKKVWGNFSIATTVTPGTSVISKADDDLHDILTIVKDGTDVTLNGEAWIDGLVLNIPLPVSADNSDKYTQITLSAYDAISGGTPTLTRTIPFAYKATRARGTRKNVTFQIFSVSAEKRVILAPGNLQYNAAEETKWRFAEHQYTMIGATKWSTSGWMDAFGWGTWTGDSPNPTYTSGTSSTYTWNSKDFVGDPTGNGYTWFTLSSSEWNYITGRAYNVTLTEGGSTLLYGAILLPNGWPSPASLPTLTSTQSYDVNIITLDEWSEFENYGAVFLPAAGNYSKDSPYGNNNPNRIRYWSRTIHDSSSAYDFRNKNYGGGVFEINDTPRATKAPVRLAREIK